MKPFLERMKRNFIKQINKFRYRGNQIYCNFCEKSYKEFLMRGLNVTVLAEYNVFGAGPRKTQCPVCSSFDRERAVKIILEKYIFNKSDNRLRILHVAPERNLEQYLRKKENCDYISIDLLSTKVDYNMNLMELQFEDHSFDLIIVNHVMEHIKDDTRALKEVKRVLKPGGYAIIQVPYTKTVEENIEHDEDYTEAQNLEYYGQEDHVRIYAFHSYLKLLKESGFEINLIDYDDLYSEGLDQGLNDEEVFFLTTTN